MSPARSRVIRVDESSLPALTEFIRAVWNPEATVESVRASREAEASRNPANPGEAPPTFLFMLEEHPIGHLTTIPARLCLGDHSWPAHWLKGFWVLPEHRNGPVGFMLVKEAMAQLDCAMATAVDEAPRRVFGAFKFKDLGALRDHVRLLRPGRVIRRLDLEALGMSTGGGPLARGLRWAQLPGLAGMAGLGVQLGAGAWSAAAGRPSAAVVTRTVSTIDACQADALWETVRQDGLASPQRDGAYLEARYGADAPGYDLVEARRDGHLVGFAAIRSPRDEGDARLRGIRVATLSDLCCAVDDRGVGLALLRAAEAVGRTRDADALVCSASHPALVAWLRQRAYAPLSGSLHFLVRDPDGSRGFPDALDAWWITRADGNADEVF